MFLQGVASYCDPPTPTYASHIAGIIDVKTTPGLFVEMESC
jgi:hypothetical protein